jgi:hypothetical protein
MHHAPISVEGLGVFRPYNYDNMVMYNLERGAALPGGITYVLGPCKKAQLENEELVSAQLNRMKLAAVSALERVTGMLCLLSGAVLGRTVRLNVDNLMNEERMPQRVPPSTYAEVEMAYVSSLFDCAKKEVTRLQACDADLKQKEGKKRRETRVGEGAGRQRDDGGAVGVA